MEYLQEVYLDINPDSSYLVVTAKQYDKNTRGVLVHITKDGQPYTITGTSVQLRVKKPDGHTVLGTTTVNNTTNTVKAIFTEQCLTMNGRAYADLVELSNNQVLSTVSFIIDIRPSPKPSPDVESMDDYPVIYEFVTNAEEVIASVREWADGYHGNEPVTSGSPAYKNNSKYWATRAKNVANTMNFTLDPNTGVLSYTFENP